MEYQEIFRDIAAVSGGDSYLFLDDLYQIGRSDQPSLINLVWSTIFTGLRRIMGFG
jgi:hypothetical protein